MVNAGLLDPARKGTRQRLMVWTAVAFLLGGIGLIAGFIVGSSRRARCRNGAGVRRHRRRSGRASVLLGLFTL